MKSTTTFQGKNKNLIVSLLLIFAILFTVIFSRINKFADSWSNFATVFLGIFIEAVPFLLMGTLASGLVEVFISPEFFQKIKPKSAILSALAGCFLGLVFPVCECGVVPLVRRLYQKGLPISTGIAFLLAAPVINPIVIFSTASAFGFGRMLWMRIGFTLLIAFITGLVFSAAADPSEVLQPRTPDNHCELCDHEEHDYTHIENDATSAKNNTIERLFSIARVELFDMGRYLIFGALISAAMQTFIPPIRVAENRRGPDSLCFGNDRPGCAVVDLFHGGFLRRPEFSGKFQHPSILAFLLYGPMVDIKSMLMFTQVFKRRSIVYLLTIPLVLSIVICVAMNYFWI